MLQLLQNAVQILMSNDGLLLLLLLLLQAA
jgi:hypothetical protein